MKNRKKRNIKFSGIIRNIIVVLFLVLLLEILSNILSLSFAKDQVSDYIQSTTKFYSTQLDQIFGDIRSYLADAVINSPDVNTVKYSFDKIASLRASQRINEKLEFFRITYGEDFHLFIFYPDADYFNTSNRGNLDITELPKRNMVIADFIRNDYQISQSVLHSTWQAAEIDGIWYALNYVVFDDIYACAYITMEDLADSINTISLGHDSYVSFVSSEHIPYNNQERLKSSGLFQNGIYLLQKDSFKQKTVVVNHELINSDFHISLITANNLKMMASMRFQFLVFGLLLIGVLTAAYTLYEMKEKVIKPIKYFSENLSRIQEDSGNLYYDSYQIAELEEANQLFKTIISQMKNLKIEMYEQTLDQQKLQIDYMHLQIQPHFYINCMSLIYSMASMEDYEPIKQLSSHVSDYFRYIFKSTPDYVDLQLELQHIKNYLEICKIRYQNRLDYRIELEGDIEHIMIPPLLLHTFVENSVKYSMAKTGRTQIYIHVEQILIEKIKFLYIVIEDTGQGFSESILEQLQNKTTAIEGDRIHIGIINSIKRLDLMYHQKARISFHNKTQGGALVKICIPIEMFKQQER